MSCEHKGRFVSTCDDCLVEISADRAWLRSENANLKLQNSELQIKNDNQKSLVEMARKERDELQARYDIYAKHLKTCVVWLFPEIPCDCGFLTNEVKRNDQPHQHYRGCGHCDCVGECKCMFGG